MPDRGAHPGGHAIPMRGAVHRRVRRALLLLALAAAALPATARAQTPGAAVVPDPHNEPFVLGRRLRLQAPVFGPNDIVGMVDSLVGDVVVLDTMLPRAQRGLFDGGTIPVERYRRIRLRVGDIKEVYTSGGVARTGAIVKYGLVTGLSAGVLFGVSGSQQYNPTLGDMAAHFVPGFIIGALAGGAVGAYNGRERWTLVPGPYYLDSPPVGRAP